MLIAIFALVVTFATGVAVGSTFKVKVDDAISALKAAEANALVTLGKINNHKAT